MRPLDGGAALRRVAVDDMNWSHPAPESGSDRQSAPCPKTLFPDSGQCAELRPSSVETRTAESGGVPVPCRCRPEPTRLCAGRAPQRCCRVRIVVFTGSLHVKPSSWETAIQMRLGGVTVIAHIGDERAVLAFEQGGLNRAGSQNRLAQPPWSPPSSLMAIKEQSKPSE